MKRAREEARFVPRITAWSFRQSDRAPSRPIARGMAGPGLLANVLVSKYCDHIPLHRLSRIYGRAGVVIDRSTMAGWVGLSEKLFDPLVAALGRYVLAAEKVHADDTPVAVLDPGRGHTKTGRLWVYVRDDRPAGSTEPPAAWYRYSPNRRGEHPQAHLANYGGIRSPPRQRVANRLGEVRLPRHRSRIARLCAAVPARQSCRTRSPGSRGDPRTVVLFGARTQEANAPLPSTVWWTRPS